MRTRRTRAAAVALAATLGVAGCGGSGGGGEKATAPVAGDLAAANAECSQVQTVQSSGRQLRGMWIATVANMDWPSKSGEAAAQQQAEYRRMLDTAVALRLNAVFVQVRPAGDAFYPSQYEPWSAYLTGTQGKSPGYDVLRFLVDEAHKRNLEFHAWFNPYRASMDTDRGKLAANDPARLHPSWAVTYGSQLWYDPGLPQVRELAETVVLDVLKRYDVDGIHFDDYFYPYPESGDFPDQASYKAYGGGMGKAAWRRKNVDTLVSDLSTRIHQLKPWVKFGISPFGVWRNKSADPAGSATSALQSYDDKYADTPGWIKKGWLDYVAPQLYWQMSDPRAGYATLVGWWARQVAGTNVQLWIGQPGYQVATWKKPAELSRHLTLDAKYPQVSGEVFFSAGDLMRNPGGFATRIRADHFQRPALVPVVPTSSAAVVLAPASVRAVSSGGKVRVSWRGTSTATQYAIYRADGRAAGCAAMDSRRLVATVRAGGAAMALSDPTARRGATYTYYVTALDRMDHQSTPARGATVVAGRG